MPCFCICASLLLLCCLVAQVAKAYCCFILIRSQLADAKVDFAPMTKANYSKASKGFVQQRNTGGGSSAHGFGLYDTRCKTANRASAYASPILSSLLAKPKEPEPAKPRRPTSRASAPPSPKSQCKKRALPVSSTDAAGQVAPEPVAPVKAQKQADSARLGSLRSAKKAAENFCHLS